MEDRDTEIDKIHNYDTFVALKIDFETAIDFHTNQARKHKALLTTLLLTDEYLIIASTNPANRRDPITDPKEMPTNITGVIPYFCTNSRSDKDRPFPVWATARISHNFDWEDIIEASWYGVTDDYIMMMIKKIQKFKT